jgi:hypothetical protein
MISIGRVKETILTFINRFGEIITSLKKSYRKWALSPKIWTLVGILLAAVLLFWYPQWRVSQFGITSPKDLAEMENSYRVTLAQILGGIAIAISLYYTWRRINISQESQITERFTRAVDQLGAIDHLGNPAVEIRLGGIYALERISSESEKDYWPIMEILTAYVRKNSSAETFGSNKVTHLSMDIQANESTTSKFSESRKILLDIQAILTVIGKHDHSKEPNMLNLQITCLEGADLRRAHLERADLYEAHLEGAGLYGAHLERADLREAHLEGADLRRAHLEEADLYEAHLEGADLERAENLSLDQLSQVKTLYETTIDHELLISLKEKYPDLFKPP